ncbi:MAG TPA: urease subunit gamma [Nitrososphaera sp.]|jgi:urease subunit gamma
MIHVRAVVRGEPELAPTIRIFNYSTADEEIFFGSASVVEEKVQRKIRINASEALVAYCAFIVRSIRSGEKVRKIQEQALKLLTEDSVMIGVPESMRSISFAAMIDEQPVSKIELDGPIPAKSYSLA